MLILNLIGFIQSIFLGSLLLISGFKKNKVHLIGGVLLLVFALLISNSIRILAWGSDYQIWIEIICNLSILTIGPLLYLYAKESFSQKSIAKNDWAHFIPIAILLPITMVLYFVRGEVPVYFEVTAFLFLVVSLAIYLLLAIRILSQNKVSNSVKFTIYGFAIIWHINLIVQIFGLFHPTINEHFLIGSTLLLSMLILILNYNHWIELINTINKPKSRLNIDKNKSAIILAKIENELMKNKPYLAKDFSLQKLSTIIDEPSSYISHVINTQKGIKFTKYIGELRIYEFVSRLNKDDIQNKTIMAMAEEVGFKSSATFNKFFKATFNQLPSDYIKTIKQS